MSSASFKVLKVIAEHPSQSSTEEWLRSAQSRDSFSDHLTVKARDSSELEARSGDCVPAIDATAVEVLGLARQIRLRLTDSSLDFASRKSLSHHEDAFVHSVPSGWFP